MKCYIDNIVQKEESRKINLALNLTQSVNLCQNKISCDTFLLLDTKYELYYLNVVLFESLFYQKNKKKKKQKKNKTQTNKQTTTQTNKQTDNPTNKQTKIKQSETKRNKNKTITKQDKNMNNLLIYACR